MSVHEMNRVLIQLYTDEIFRAYFFADKAAALATFSVLDHVEKTALTSLQQADIDEFARGLRAKAAEMVFKNFTPLFEYNHRLLQWHFRRFYLNRKRTSFESMLNYSFYFGEFLKESLIETDEHDALYNMAKFLTQKLKASLRVFPKCKIKTKKLTNAAKPILSPHLYVETYDYDMLALVKQPSILKKAKKAAYAYAMYDEQGVLRTEVISPALLVFLQQCDGVATLSELLTFFKEAYSEKTSNDLKSSLPILLAKNYIYLI